MHNKELNEQLKVLIEKNDDLLAQMKVLKDQLQVKHVVIDTHVECQEKYAKLEAERYEHMIRYSAYFDNDKQHRKQIADQKVLFDKMNVQLVELDKHVRDLKNTVLEKNFKISELEECVCNKDLEIEKCLERLNVCEYKLHKIGQTNQTVHMIMPSRDNSYNGRNGIGFENLSYFEKVKDLRLTLYDEKVNGLGYTLMFLIHSDEALEIEKFKRSRENKIEFAYDYGNLNAKKIIIDLEDKVVSLLEKEKANLKTIESMKSKGFESSENAISELENQSENDCHVVEKECDKKENSKVIAPGMFKLSMSQSVSSISMLKTSCDLKNVEIKLKRKRRKRKSSKQNDKHMDNDVLRANRDFVHFSDLDTLVVLEDLNIAVLFRRRKGHLILLMLICLLETSSAFVCNDAMNVSCNSRMCDVFDDNNFFIFDDESVRISPVSKMPFRKKPHDSLNVRSKLIAGYGDVVIGSMTIKNVYYVEGLGHNLFSVGKFCDKGLKVAFRKSTCFVRNEDVVDLLTGDRSSNWYTIALNEVASNSLTCLLAKASSSQSWLTPQQNGVVKRWNRTLVEAARTMLTFANLSSFLWAEAIATAYFTQNRSIIHKRFDKTLYELMNKRKPNIKFFRVFGCRCYLLNDYEDIGKLKAKGDIGVFVGYSKDSAAFRIYNKRTRKIHESVNVNFDEISEMASKNSIMKSSTTNVETSINEEVFHEVFESFQGESSSSSLNDGVQQSPEEDAYFDATTSFHDPSNVHTFYQPYLHEKKWTKDHPLPKIIGDPKSSVRTRGQLANSCLFLCLLSSIEPFNVAEALRDAD
nr:retrovirus-related Pol polyprotein from transposon TNT 1-94 [Tanacetum cinerariifolium]